MSRSIATDNDTSQSKKVAAEKAVGFVKSGMIVGLGHGSTAIFAVRMIAEKVTRGALKKYLRDLLLPGDGKRSTGAWDYTHHA